MNKLYSILKINLLKVDILLVVGWFLLEIMLVLLKRLISLHILKLKSNSFSGKLNRKIIIYHKNKAILLLFSFLMKIKILLKSMFKKICLLLNMCIYYLLILGCFLKISANILKNSLLKYNILEFLVKKLMILTKKVIFCKIYKMRTLYLIKIVIFWKMWRFW